MNRPVGQAKRAVVPWHSGWCMLKCPRGANAGVAKLRCSEAAKLP
jgi:hypothetical protein